MACPSLSLSDVTTSTGNALSGSTTTVANITCAAGYAIGGEASTVVAQV